MGYWIVVAICEHVVAQEALAGGNKGIGVDESTDLRIVITGLEVVQLRFLGVVVATRGFWGPFRGAFETSQGSYFEHINRRFPNIDPR